MSFVVNIATVLIEKTLEIKINCVEIEDIGENEEVNEKESEEKSQMQINTHTIVKIMVIAQTHNSKFPYSDLKTKEGKGAFTPPPEILTVLG